MVLPWELRHINHDSSDHEKREVLKFWTGDYVWATSSRLSVPWGDETYGFVAAFDGSRCVGTTSHTISPRGLGILSQVFTDPDYRGRGIATAMVDETVGIFRRHSTKAAYLASGKVWVRQLYRKFGFEFVGAMGRRHGFKLTLQPAGDDGALFRTGQAMALRSIKPDNQGDLCALFNAGHDCVVKHYALGCYMGSYFEGEFYTLRRMEETKGYGSTILDGEETVLGLATILPSNRRHENHKGILDWLVHPEYHDQTQALLDNILNRCELNVLDAYADTSEEARHELLEANQFKQIGRLKDHVRIQDDSFTLLHYRSLL